MLRQGQHRDQHKWKAEKRGELKRGVATLQEETVPGKGVLDVYKTINHCAIVREVSTNRKTGKVQEDIWWKVSSLYSDTFRMALVDRAITAENATKKVNNITRRVTGNCGASMHQQSRADLLLSV